MAGGQALVFTAEINVCNALESLSYSIVRVNAETREQTTLISEDRRLFGTVGWPTVEEIILEDKDGNLWQMDAMSGQVTE